MIFTESQRRAIEERGASLLVSAAAGSGKTRVLTERLMGYVTEGEDIDRFLVITYTRAAAAELRSRILGRLGTLAAEDPTNIRLRRQQNLCYRAKIGTIHSFCTELLRENCHHLGLSPAFRVMDADKAEAMRRAVLEKLLDARYENIDRDADFRLLCDSVGAGRDDRRLVETLLELHTKLRAHPDPEAWAREQMDAFSPENVTDAGQTVWGRELLSAAAESARDWAERMERAAEEIFAADARIAKAFGPGFEETASALRDFAHAAESVTWDKAAALLPIPFPRIVTPRNYEDPDFAGRMKALRAACKDAAGDWAEALQGSSEKLLADMRAVAPAMRALLILTLDFDRAFDAEKRRAGELDFSDLEHYAARLLTDRETGEPTWIAVETAQRFTEIMVDEYQVVNAVQERIFTAVSRAGRNLFLVGDVKQSIYRFRLADPGIFLDRYRRFSAPDGGGWCVLLRENFRSRKSVLNAANHVFGDLMSEALGELDYDEDAALRFGASYYPEGTDEPVQFCVIDPASAGSDEDTPEKAALEARFVAGKIRALMVAETPVYENGGTRKCRWGDFAVLLRSPAANGGVFRRVLEGEGIPVVSRQGGGFFTSLEVTVTVNLLSVIDNPHADVPLISVLRSPAFGFDGDALAEIRAASREGDYYGAVRAAAEAGNERCAAFLEMLDALRAAAPELGADELVWRVYNETNLFALCAAMRDADARRGNLMQLFEYARRFESGVGHGLHRFIRWLLRLAERGEEPAVGGGDDAVKIMSIHKSKGLEFPFVFLSDLSHRFNKSDTKDPVLLHTRLGLGPKRTDANRGIEYPTLPRRAIARRLLTETLSEEMRVLYVGMTRARERLFLTCTWKNAAEAIEKLRMGLSDPIAPDILRGALSPAQWLACCAAAGEEKGPLRLQIVREVDSADSTETAQTQAETPSDEAAVFLRESLDFVYPYALAETLPSKLTATGLTGRADDEERAHDAASLLPEDEPVFRRPMLGQDTKTNAAQRGTATHAALQHLDLSLAGSEDGLQGELRRLSWRGLLTPEQAACVDTGALLRFARSALCKRILAADDCRREFRFTLLAEAADYFDAPAGEKLLLQGVVDCFIVEDGAITIIDYKTDRVTSDEIPARAVHYAPQLRAYAAALGRICSLPVRQCLLYFLTPGVEYPLPL